MGSRGKMFIVFEKNSNFVVATGNYASDLESQNERVLYLINKCFCGSFRGNLREKLSLTRLNRIYG